MHAYLEKEEERYRFYLYYNLFQRSLTAEQVSRYIQYWDTTYMTEFMRFSWPPSTYIDAWVSDWKADKLLAYLPRDADTGEGLEAFTRLTSAALVNVDYNLYNGLCRAFPGAPEQVARITMQHHHDGLVTADDVRKLITTACPEVRQFMNSPTT